MAFRSLPPEPMCLLLHPLCASEITAVSTITAASTTLRCHLSVMLAPESFAYHPQFDKNRDGFHGIRHKSRKSGRLSVSTDTNTAMINPPTAKVCCTPKRCDAAPAIKFPMGIAPMNESMNMLITRPRISSLTNFCNRVLVTATEQTIAKPSPKRKISDTGKSVESEKHIRHRAKPKSPPSTNHPL